MGVEPEEGFVSDDELKSLLERWVAPGPSRTLDKRIETSFKENFLCRRLSQSCCSPGEKGVSMKFCSLCEEEFADKFSFCPVDGTPLTVVARRRSKTRALQSPVIRSRESKFLSTRLKFLLKANRFTLLLVTRLRWFCATSITSRCWTTLA